MTLVHRIVIGLVDGTNRSGTGFARQLRDEGLRGRLFSFRGLTLLGAGFDSRKSGWLRLEAAISLVQVEDNGASFSYSPRRRIFRMSTEAFSSIPPPLRVALVDLVETKSAQPLQPLVAPPGRARGRPGVARGAENG